MSNVVGRSLAAVAAILVSVGAECGCLGPSTEPSEGLPRPPEVLSIEPTIDVAPDAAVVVRFSAAVVLASRAWPVHVRDATGAELGLGVSLEDGGLALRISPEPSWPEGAHLDVVIEAGFVDALGQPLLLAGVSSFETRPAAEREAELTVRSPLPTRSSPPNLVLLAVAIEPVPKLMPERLFLVSGGVRVEAKVERTRPEGVVLARLPPYQADCDPLCGGAIYRVALEGAGRAADGARGQIVTATITDVLAPVLTSTSVLVRAEGVTVLVETSEPVVLTGSAVRDGAEPIPLAVPVVADGETFVEPTAPLAADADYRFEISGEDMAGNALLPFVVPVHTAPRLAVNISEIVAVPTHDWGDSEGGSVPFDDRPGTGAVTAADAWVELVNLSNDPIDLEGAGLVLRAIDGTPTETVLESAPAAYFGDGGSRRAWLPGEAMVVRPRGSFARRAFVVEVASGDLVLDRVEVGAREGAIASSASPPDLAHESLARGIDGRFRWCVPTPGDPLPNVACVAQPR